MVSFFYAYRRGIGIFAVCALIAGAFFFGGYYRMKCYWPFCKKERDVENLVFKSNLLVLKGTEILQDEESARYGDLDVHGDTVYYANPRGAIYDVSTDNQLIFESIFDISSPLDLDDAPPEARFGSIRGLEVTGEKGKEVFFVSVLVREHDSGCFRIAVLKRQRHEDGWQRIYGTPECFSQEQMFEESGRFHMVGGKLETYDEDTLLLTVGNFHYEPTHDEFDEQGRDIALHDKAGHHLSKIMMMDGDGRDVRIFASGVRNSQGLVVTDDGQIYETEHGMLGGR
ncbi:MAG: PQQ-dependent sugar dehydrogenase [Alphaproteobacteria bacterium GM202ARS2]|nr:PQQ-dependent sugar dehydrogenase [Alphaproteobacteria bacterium GM202ARS2]